MREALVCDLVKNLLGPRSGPHEVLAGKPLSEYITGILAPAGTKADIDKEAELEAELGGAAEDREGDSGSEPEISPSSMLSSVLDPKKTPSTMGLTFSVSSSGRPAIDVCVTWARYLKDADAWKRDPKYAVFRVGRKNDDVIRLDSDGNPVVKGGEISVHARVGKKYDGARSVSIYVVNRIRVA